MLYSKSKNGFFDPHIHGGGVPPDAVEITDQLYRNLLDSQAQGKSIAADANGQPMIINPLPPSATQTFAAYTSAIQQHLDDFARTRNYDGILSAATYATSSAPKFAAEGQYALAARDATWAACYALLAEIEAGTRPMPSLEELLVELPALTWPGG